MKVVVTGAAGFIGSRLVEILANDPQCSQVVAIDSLSDYYSPKLKLDRVRQWEPGQKVQFVQEDLNNVDCEQLLDGAEVVYHQAAQPGVRASWGREFGRYLADNVQATQRLLEAARTEVSLRRFVYASSSSVYGDAETFPTREDLRPRPRSPYGVTKLAAEHLCSLYAENFGVPTVSLRYFTVYGPGQRPDMAFSRFISAALRGEVISVYGDGEQIREFTYVDDIVEANLKAGSSDISPGAVMNLSGGSSVSINNVLESLRRLSGELVVKYLDPVPGDVLRTGGTTDVARELLGWAPSTALETGLARQFDAAIKRRDVA